MKNMKISKTLNKNIWNKLKSANYKNAIKKLLTTRLIGVSWEYRYTTELR